MELFVYLILLFCQNQIRDRPKRNSKLDDFRLGRIVWDPSKVEHSTWLRSGRGVAWCGGWLLLLRLRIQLGLQ